ncbi:MAG TPA: hypothetical protein DD417_06605, partial [Elusimicrobia bacterium]|nr:hypothetical protein [Elusimicrobiota bacterium]
DRYTAVLRSRPGPAPRLAEGIDPAAAMMMVVWSFFNYFTMERLFRVKGLYGMEETEVIGMFSEVFRRGLLPR